MNCDQCLKLTYRQQREEIMRKQEKLESMIRKKKDARPESPTGRRNRKTRRPSMPSRRFGNTRSNEVSCNVKCIPFCLSYLTLNHLCNFLSFYWTNFSSLLFLFCYSPVHYTVKYRYNTDLGSKILYQRCEFTSLQLTPGSMAPLFVLNKWHKTMNPHLWVAITVSLWWIFDQPHQLSFLAL